MARFSPRDPLNSNLLTQRQLIEVHKLLNYIFLV